jgi:O-antigen/teichoic acid export membrane protein
MEKQCRIVVDPVSPTSIAGALVTLARDQTKRREMAERARKAAEKHQWANESPNVIQLYAQFEDGNVQSKSYRVGYMSKVQDVGKPASRIIAENTGCLILGDTVHKVAVTVFLSVLAHRLGPEEFGIYTLSLTLGGIAIAIADPGVSKILFRDIAADRQSQSLLLGAGVVLRLAFLPVGFGFLLGLIRLLGYPPDVVRVVAVGGLGVLVLGGAENYVSAFKATSRSYLVMAVYIFRSVVLAAIVWMVAAGPVHVMQVAIAYLAKGMLVVAAAVALAASAGIHHALPRQRDLTSVLRRGVPLGLTGLAVFGYASGSVVVLSLMRPMEVMGFFQAAYRLVAALSPIGGMLTIGVFPLFVQLNGTNREGLNEAYYRTTKYLFALSLGIALGTTLLAEKLILLFFGSRFTASVQVLQLLVWSQVLIYQSLVCGQLLLAQDRRWVLFRQAAWAAALNLVANVLAVNFWGALGAALTTLGTEMFALTFLTWHVHRSGVRLALGWRRNLAQAVAAGAVMSSVLLLGKGLPIAPLVVLGGVTYFVALYLTRFFDHEDGRLCRQVLGVSRTQSAGGTIQRVIGKG